TITRLVECSSLVMLEPPSPAARIPLRDSRRHLKNVILSVAKDLSCRMYETLTCTPGTCGAHLPRPQVPGSVGREACPELVEGNAPSHRPEAMSLRERDRVFLR
ncbi:MAG: hypothetical protein ABIU06_00245, partial [Anaerolineales bacterium]